MASPARKLSYPVPVRSTRRPVAVSGARWAYIMGQQPAFTQVGGTLYISKFEGLRCAIGVAWAVAIQATAVAGIYGVWRLCHWLF